MNYEALGFWWSVLNTLGLCVLGLVSWLQKRSIATANDIREHRKWTEKEFDQANKHHQRLAERVNRIETELRHVPGREEITELVEKMGETQAQLAHAVGELTALNRQMQLVQQHLLRGGE